ncbi:transketolase, partial [Mesorhizobium sp. M8A.F.Ca.ET.218.01.1.1]
SPFAQAATRRHKAPAVPVPAQIPWSAQVSMSTQQGFGLLMHEIAKSNSDFAKRVVTTSPDVTVSTNLGAWVNKRGLFARAGRADIFREERIPSTFNWTFSPSGQHIELGIPEMNLFTMFSSLVLS